MGYCPESSSYRIWDKQKKKIVLSRDVKFDENTQKVRKSHNSGNSENSDISKYSASSNSDIREVEDPMEKYDRDSETAHEENTNLDEEMIGSYGFPQTRTGMKNNENSNSNSDWKTRFLDDSGSSDHEGVRKEIYSTSGSDSELTDSSSITASDMGNVKDKSKELEIKPPTPKKLSPKVKKTVTRTSTQVTRPPVPHYSASDQLKAQTHIIEVGDEPQTWNEMINSSDKELWMDAAKDEMKSLEKMKTWELVPRTPDMSVVKCKWIFKIKYDGNGNVERHKARLVAKGFTQKHGIDYTETFSPVVRFETLRYLFAIAASNNWNIQQMDVKTAFLNGELNETIYMEQPEGFVKDRGKVCLLKKSLYGLKQAPRCWNEKFRNFMKISKFSQSTADPCLFILHEKDEMVVVALYVDDLVITGNEKLIKWTKSKLSEHFDMKDLGDIKYILGIQVSRDSNGIYLSQSTFVTRVLEKFNMSECKPNGTPAIAPTKDDSELFTDSTLYMQAVGSLNYLAT